MSSKPNAPGISPSGQQNLSRCRPSCYTCPAVEFRYSASESCSCFSSHRLKTSLESMTVCRNAHQSFIWCRSRTLQSSFRTIRTVHGVESQVNDHTPLAEIRVLFVQFIDAGSGFVEVPFDGASAHGYGRLAGVRDARRGPYFSFRFIYQIAHLFA